jgi:hypothetical protein
MFRVTVIETPSGETWILQGQLIGEFASEVNARWLASHELCCDLQRKVDLTDVTVIDKIGEEVLLTMISHHASFVAPGLYTKHLLEILHSRLPE